MHEIYISYAWNDREKQNDSREHIVDELCMEFEKKSYKIIRDKEALRYKDKISEFTQKIAKSNFVIAVISDKYVRSKYCMLEAVETFKKGGFEERVFPIILNDSKIYDDVEYGEIIIHWQQEVKKLKGIADAIEDDSSKIEYLELKKNYEEISRNVAAVLKLLRDMVLLNETVNLETRFQDILSAISQRIAASDVVNPSPILLDPKPSLVFRALTLLNYHEEYNVFDYYSQHRYGLFYIHGSSARGQYWLARRFTYAITQEDAEFEIIKIAESKQSNSDTIERIENLLKITPGKVYEIIAMKLVHKKLIFIIDENDPEYFINNFWTGFLNYLQETKATNTKPLFIFLYDGNENEKCQQIINSYSQQGHFDSQSCTFPFVEILIRKDDISSKLIEDWFNNVRGILPQLKFSISKNQLVQLILGKSQFVSEGTIRAICKQFGLSYTEVVELKN